MRKQFNLELLERFPVVREDTPDGRVYKFNGKSYPSVTSILDEQTDKRWLDAWKKRVGAEEAARVIGKAKTRGTAMHTLYEKYLLNDAEFDKGAMPTNILNFQQLRPLLDRCIHKVYGCEFQVFSEHYNAAGTTDAVVNWLGEDAIIDFKTSKKRKKLKDIPNYLVQTTVYGRMVNEMYGMNIQKGIILMTVDHESPIMFEIHMPDYDSLVNKIFIENRRNANNSKT